MKVVVTHRARKDLIDVFLYNSKKSIKSAIETDKNIRSYISSLQVFPYIGRYVPEILDKNFRERIYKKIRIIYYISEMTNTIYIRYIFNSRQDLKTFFDLHINKI